VQPTFQDLSGRQFRQILRDSNAASLKLQQFDKVAQEEARRKAEERKKATQKPPVIANAEPTAAPPSTPESVPSSPSAGTLGLFPLPTSEAAPTRSKGGLAL